YRPPRQYGVGDAVRRLAVVQPGSAGPGLFHYHPAADDLAGRGRPWLRAARHAAVHHAFARHGVARRRAVYGVRYAGRRPAGSMDGGVFPASRRLRYESARSDRRAVLAYRSFPGLVLATHAD